MSDAGFSGFFQRGRSRKEALRRVVECTPEAVRNLLARGVNRREDNRMPIRELGWSIGLWSGSPDDEAFGLDIHCGCFSQHVGNNVTLTLPPTGPHSVEQARSQVEDLFEALVTVWGPEQAIFCYADELRWESGRVPSNVVAFRRLG